MSDSLWPHGLQHARLSCPSPSYRVCWNSCPLSQWWHPIISSSVVPFFSCPKSFPGSKSFSVSWLFASRIQIIGTSASVLAVNIQGWFPLELSLRFMIAAAKLLQSCLTPCDPSDGSLPGSPIPGILQARTLEWVAISFSNAWKWKVKVKSLSRVQLWATPWTAVYQDLPSMGFSRQQYWNGVPLPSPRFMIRPWLNTERNWGGHLLPKCQKKKYSYKICD